MLEWAGLVSSRIPFAKAAARLRARIPSKTGAVLDAFIVARNPEADSSLPYLVFLPIDGGTWLKARETWPRSSRVYCHPAPSVEADILDVIERVAVLSCERRGPVVDLVLDRAANRRAQLPPLSEPSARPRFPRSLTIQNP